MKITVDDLQYFNHLPSCNIRRDWSEAQDALSACPYEPDQQAAYQEVEIRSQTCTCGMEAALSRIIHGAVSTQTAVE